MKMLLAVFMTLALVTGLGCETTKASKQGGISPINEQFSIVVPTSGTVKQGAETTVEVKLNRGAYFKQNVRLEVSAMGIHVTPNDLLVYANDLPDVKLQISAGMDAALGEYTVSVKGTPTSGDATSVKFPVKVEAAEVAKTTSTTTTTTVTQS